MLRKFLLPLLAALVAGCTDPSAADYDAVAREGLVLSLSTPRSEIAPGDTVRLLARLANHNEQPVRLDFSSGCQVLTYVESAEGRTVYPYGGGWMCTAALSSLELAPGEVKEQVFVWTGQSRVHDRASFVPAYDPLPAGRYRAFAVLGGTLRGMRIELRSNAERLTVR